MKRRSAIGIRHLNVMQITVWGVESLQHYFQEKQMRATGKIRDRQRAPRDWLVLLTVVAVIAIPQTSIANDDITGTVSQTEPTIRQDGTPAHPYANASQCLANTDIVIWPSGRSVPSVPPSISVCFVGNQPVEISGAAPVQIRDR